MRTLSRRMLIGGGATTLALAVVGAFGMSTFTVTAAQQEMTPPEILDAVRSGRILLVDIRRPDEWQETGLAEGAIPIDLRRDDFVDAIVAARAYETQPVAVICARGIRSRRMTLRLNEARITPIIDVPEGMLGSRAGPGWLERDLPVTVWNG